MYGMNAAEPFEEKRVALGRGTQPCGYASLTDILSIKKVLPNPEDSVIWS